MVIVGAFTATFYYGDRWEKEHHCNELTLLTRVVPEKPTLVITKSGDKRTLDR